MDDDPAYVLIDCGYKPGSTKMTRRKRDEQGKPVEPPQFLLADQPSIKEIVANIHEATAGHVQVAVITHEHQDHVNGITERNFMNLKIDQTWMAWTENGMDKTANDLREKFKDQLLGLLSARERLSQEFARRSDERTRFGMAQDEKKKLDAADRKKLDAIDDLLAFELGGDDDEPFDPQRARATLTAGGLGADAGGGSRNKISMKLFKDKAKDGPLYLKPHQRIFKIPNAKSARAFPLGPPRAESLEKTLEALRTLDPEGDEEFHGINVSGRSAADFFISALGADQPANDEEHAKGRYQGWASPFAAKYRVPLSQVETDPASSKFFSTYYRGVEAKSVRDGNGELVSADGPRDKSAPSEIKVSLAQKRGKNEIFSDAAFRRIDDDWLTSAGQIALDMNDQTNNASLVLAFELAPRGKVLLFAADAQRGNWLSWSDKDFVDEDDRENGGPRTITARDLLSRTVLYKVGHHGSHNATLNGRPEQDWANLSWMGTSAHGHEFTAMITAVRAWAETQKGWDHPLPAIKKALMIKAAGRVLQTDTDLEFMTKPNSVTDPEWNTFKGKCKG